MTAKNRQIKNFVNDNKVLAESFLRAQQEASTNIPSKISGFVAARFGDYVLLFQYNNNKLVAGASIHHSNVDSLTDKLRGARDGLDYLEVWKASSNIIEHQKEDS